jgi:hypothetical protein
MKKFQNFDLIFFNYFFYLAGVLNLLNKTAAILRGLLSRYQRSTKTPANNLWESIKRQFL